MHEYTSKNERWFDDGSGAKRVRVNRVKCLSCGKTHALIWHDMVPYKLRSEGLCLRTFRSWAEETSMRLLVASTGIGRTSLRRTLSHVKSRVSLMLARPPDRAALAAAVAGVGDGALSSEHLLRGGRQCRRVPADAAPRGRDARGPLGPLRRQRPGLQERAARAHMRQPGCALIHAPVRDGASKGKIERLNRTCRMQLLSCLPEGALDSLESLNDALASWVAQTIASYRDAFALLL